MVAGIALVAFGLHEALAHVDEPLPIEAAAALLGGTALYLLAHVAFYWRNTAAWKVQRLVAAIVLGALIAAATLVDALAAVALTAVTIGALVVYENAHYAEARHEIRGAMLLHGHGHGPGAGPDGSTPGER